MSRPRATYEDSRSPTPGLVRVVGSFTTKDGDAPSVVTGAGFTVSAPATAVYTLTGRAGKFAGVVTAYCGIRENLSSTTKKALFKVITHNTDPWTATIVTQSTAGTAGTLSGPIVDFAIEFKDTTATK